MTPDDLCEVSITAPDATWLEQLCHTLVEQRLASSAHVIHGVTSIYQWQGAVHKTTEGRAFLRSRHALLDSLVAFVVARHPYDIPSITAVPIAGGNTDYLEWIRAETHAATEGSLPPSR